MDAAVRVDVRALLQPGRCQAGEGGRAPERGGPASLPGVAFRWYKDGALLMPGSKYRTLSEPHSGLQVLEIRAATKGDLGHYECEVR